MAVATLLLAAPVAGAFVSPASYSIVAAIAAPVAAPTVSNSISPASSRAEQLTGEPIELAQARDNNQSKPPVRGSSAELNGGSSADRYGGHSADRRGVAGRYDPRNRGVRQYSARNRKRDDDRPKQNDEMQDQEQDPPTDHYTFAPIDPSASRDRSARD